MNFAAKEISTYIGDKRKFSTVYKNLESGEYIIKCSFKGFDGITKHAKTLEDAETIAEDWVLKNENVDRDC